MRTVFKCEARPPPRPFAHSPPLVPVVLDDLYARHSHSSLPGTASHCFHKVQSSLQDDTKHCGRGAAEVHFVGVRPCKRSLIMLPKLLQLSKSGDGDAANSVSLPSRAQTDRGLDGVEQLRNVRHEDKRRNVCTCSFHGGLPGSFLIGKPALAKSRWRMRFTVRFSLVREASPTHGRTVRIMLDHPHLQPSVLLKCNPTTF